MIEKTFKTSGTCSAMIHFSLEDDGTLHDVRFVGGCDGNLKAIGKLVEGRPAAEVAELLRGNTCGRKNTSCADQLARAIQSSEYQKNR